MKFAVMGNPIAHSLSPLIHQHFAEITGISLTYERICVVNNLKKNIQQFFEKGGCGLNITAPYKEEAFLLSDVQTPRCQYAQSANTLWVKDNQIYADNTDGIGFCRSISKNLNLKNARVLIIGCGGAAKGLIPCLLAQGAQITLTNRTLDKAKDLQMQYPHQLNVISYTDDAHFFDLIINAASLNLDTTQLPRSWFRHAILCHDLSYMLLEDTPFTKWSRTQSCLAKDGYEMLVEQAAEAFYVWHHIRPTVTDILNKAFLF